MSASWYYRSAGREIGPLSSNELREAVRQGIISSETLIRRGESKWTPAANVKGLLPIRVESGHELIVHSKTVAGGDVIASPPPLAANTPQVLPRIVVCLLFGLFFLIIARLYPWMTCVVSLLGIGATLPFLFRPERQRPLGTVILLLCIAFGASCLGLRQATSQNAREAAVANLVEQINTALKSNAIEDANTAFDLLSINHDVRDKTIVEDLRRRIDVATAALKVKTSNEQVLACETAGQQALTKGWVGVAENSLRAAYGQTHASDFEPAKRLGRAIVDAKIQQVKKLLDAKDFEKAQSTVNEAYGLPQIDLSRLAPLRTQIANLTVASELAKATAFVQENKLLQAELTLKKAISVEFADEIGDAELLLKKVTFLKNKDVIDASNSKAFEQKSGKIRIGDFDLADNDFDFSRYQMSCLENLDKIINDRGQPIVIPWDKGVEVELNYGSMALAMSGVHDQLSRFRIRSGSKKLTKSKGDGGAASIKYRIEPTRAVAFLFPSEFVAENGDEVQLELIIESGTGKTLSKIWIFKMMKGKG